MLPIIHEICQRGQNFTNATAYAGFQNASAVIEYTHRAQYTTQSYREIDVAQIQLMLQINGVFAVIQFFLFALCLWCRPDIFAPKLEKDEAISCNPCDWICKVWKQTKIGEGRSAKNIAGRLQNLDGAVMVRYCIMGFKFCTVAAIAGLFLIPWYQWNAKICREHENAKCCDINANAKRLGRLKGCCAGECCNVLHVSSFNLAQLYSCDGRGFDAVVIIAYILVAFFVHLSMDEWRNFDIMRKEHLSKLACGAMGLGAAQAARSIMVEVIPKPYRAVSGDALHGFFHNLFPYWGVHSAVVQAETGMFHGKVDAVVMKRAQTSLRTLRKALAPTLRKAAEEEEQFHDYLSSSESDEDVGEREGLHVSAGSSGSALHRDSASPQPELQQSMDSARTPSVAGTSLASRTRMSAMRRSSSAGGSFAGGSLSDGGTRLSPRHRRMRRQSTVDLAIAAANVGRDTSFEACLRTLDATGHVPAVPSGSSSSLPRIASSNIQTNTSPTNEEVEVEMGRDSPQPRSLLVQPSGFSMRRSTATAFGDLGDTLSDGSPVHGGPVGNVAFGLYERARAAAILAQDVFDVGGGGPEIGSSTGYVTFRTVSDRVAAEQMVLCQTDMQLMEMKPWVVHPAPEVGDINWKNAAVPFAALRFRTRCVNFGIALLMLFWVIPITVISMWTSLDVLKFRFSWIAKMQADPHWHVPYTLLTRYLPVLAQIGLLYVLPVFLEFLGTRFEAVKVKSQVQIATVGRYLAFLMVTTYCTIVGASLFKSACDILEHPSHVFEILQSEVPAVASYFLTYVMARAGLSAPMLLLYAILAVWEERDNKGRLLIRPNYAMEAGQLVLVLVLGMTYCLIAPLVSFACVVYFAFTTLVYAFLFLYVYTPEYDCHGKMWPTMFRYTLFGMLLGIMSLSGIASTYVGPLSRCSVACLVLSLIILMLFPFFEVSYAKPAQFIPLEVAREIDKRCTGRNSMLYIDAGFSSTYYVDPVITKGFEKRSKSKAAKSCGGWLPCCARRRLARDSYDDGSSFDDVGTESESGKSSEDTSGDSSGTGSAADPAEERGGTAAADLPTPARFGK